MLPLRYEKRWRIGGAFLLLGVLAGTIMPTIWWPHFPRIQLLSMDKWLHLLTVLVLSLWFAGQYARNAYWRLGVGLIAFGILIEAGQALSSYRSAEWMDLVADVCGIAIGFVIAIAGLGGWSLRFEQWLARDSAAVD